LSQSLLCAGDGYFIKLKTHPDTGKPALVQKQDTMHSHTKLVGLETKKILENNDGKQSQLFKYRETILEKPKGQDEPTRLRREYEKAQVEVLGRTTVLPWQGKTVLIEKQKDRYRFSLEGGQELTAEEAGPLADEFQSTTGPTSKFTDLVPADKAVRVKDNHDIDPKVLLKVYGSVSDAGIKIDAAKAKGSWKLTRAYKKDGRQFGVIELHVELPLREMKWSHPKAAEKLVMRPGAKMTLHGVIDGCIDGSAATATSKLDMEINGSALAPSPDNPQFELILSIKTSTKETTEESSARQADAGKGIEELQGKWRAVEMQTAGIAAPKDVLEKARLLIKDDEYIWLSGGPVDVKSRIRLDPSKSPKEIDIAMLDGPGKGSTFPGIYELEKGQLRICTSHTKDRPTDFTTKRGELRELIVLERVQPK